LDPVHINGVPGASLEWHKNSDPSNKSAKQIEVTCWEDTSIFLSDVLPADFVSDGSELTVHGLANNMFFYPESVELVVGANVHGGITYLTFQSKVGGTYFQEEIEVA
jgi:hypothetical protein